MHLGDQWGHSRLFISDISKCYCSLEYGLQLPESREFDVADTPFNCGMDLDRFLLRVTGSISFVLTTETKDASLAHKLPMFGPVR